MPVYKAPTRDTRFVLNEVLKLEAYAALPTFENASADMVDTVVEECGKFAAEVLAPLNPVGDREGCTRNPDGSVTTPSGFKEAFALYRESGWGTLSSPVEYGGQGMPHVLGFVVEEYVATANHAFGMYPGLTSGAVSAILAKASPELQAKYLPKMVTNQWLGTMNSEMPLLLSGAPGVLARTRWMMFSVRSCSPAEIKILSLIHI